jgi:hypothetical protein
MSRAVCRPQLLLGTNEHTARAFRAITLNSPPYQLGLAEAPDTGG